MSEAGPLPFISAVTVNDVVRWLLERENMLRPPEPTAKFLVLCVKLHQSGRPFPQRSVVADHLKVSVAYIDTALAQRIATGDIKITVDAAPGRAPTPRQRRITPTAEIVNLVEDAEEGRGGAGKT